MGDRTELRRPCLIDADGSAGAPRVHQLCLARCCGGAKGQFSFGGGMDLWDHERLFQELPGVQWRNAPEAA